jgi:hypothetical protein
MVVVNTGSIAGRWNLVANAGAEAEHLDGLEYGESQNLEAAFLELCYSGVCAGINNDISHDIVSLEIIQRDNHPAGRCGGSGCD